MLDEEEYGCDLSCGHPSDVSFLCPHVKDGYKRINGVLFVRNHPELYHNPVNVDLLEFTKKKQERNKRDLDFLVDRLRSKLNGTVEFLKDNPMRQECSGYRMSGGLLILAYDSFQNLKLDSDEELVREVSDVQEKYPRFFKF